MTCSGVSRCSAWSSWRNEACRASRTRGSYPASRWSSGFKCRSPGAGPYWIASRLHSSTPAVFTKTRLRDTAEVDPAWALNVSLDPAECKSA